MTATISSAELRALEQSEDEYAILDVRDEGIFSKAHLFNACTVPLRKLETGLSDQPGLFDCRIVLCDADGESEAVIAARRMSDWGFSNIRVLAGGIDGWKKSGYPIYAGMHTLSKAFGEAVEHTYATPTLSVGEFHKRKSAGEAMFVVDCRPHDEYLRSSLPGSASIPGVELPYRIQHVVKDPALPILVHCAGRTRGIMAAQNIRALGIQNPVFSLENGTMGWLRFGQDLVQPDRAAEGFDEGFRPAVEQLAAAAQIRERNGIDVANQRRVRQCLSEQPGRMTYLVDVRTLDEYASGHPDGAMHAPGGQLLQATDKYLFVRNARVVVIDDDGVRASMTAAWLKMMGWRDVFVWPIQRESMLLASGVEPRRYFRTAGVAQVGTIDAHALSKLLKDGQVDVIDLDTSIEFERAHIPGSRFARRADLPRLMASRSDRRSVVLVCADGSIAQFSTADGFDLGNVKVLEGGKQAWIAAGLPMQSGTDSVPPDIDDVWRRPLDARGSLMQSIDEYLSWEVGLAEQINADAAVRFRFP